MVLQNYWSWQRQTQSNSTSTSTINVSGITDTSGAAVTTLTLQANNSTYAYATTNNRSLIGMSLVFGSGLTTPTAEDYALESGLSGITATLSIAFVNGNNGMQIVFSATLINNGADSVTINEVGVIKPLMQSNTITKNVLIIRELLESPITIAAGGQADFVYTWTMQ